MLERGATHGLLNSIDGGVPQLSLAAFEKSLLLNVLFQEVAIVNDSHFYDSPYLAEHMINCEASGRLSLFTLACERAIIRPAFQDFKSTSLTEARQSLVDRYGKLWLEANPGLKKFFHTIEAAVDCGLSCTGVRPIRWPETGTLTTGEGFYEAVRHLLGGNEPPDIRREEAHALQVERTWDATKRWRTELVEQAASRTQRKGGTGLERLEIFRVLGDHLKVPQDKKPIDATMIIEGAMEEGGPELALNATVFIRWLSQCYHLNQARFLGSSINFPAYNTDRDFMLDSILRTPDDSAPNALEGLQCDVFLPRIEDLLRANPRELISIRDDYGKGYRHALALWNERPTEDRRSEAQDELRRYCDQICRSYQEIQRASVSALFAPTSLTSLVLNFVKALPFVGTFVSVGQNAFVLYRLSEVRHSAKPQIVEVTTAENVLSSLR